MAMLNNQRVDVENPRTSEIPRELQPGSLKETFLEHV